MRTCVAPMVIGRSTVFAVHVGPQCESWSRQRYLLNAYRVLPTRARQGMVMFVPYGDEADPTCDPAFYEEMYALLRSTGIPTVTQTLN